MLAEMGFSEVGSTKKVRVFAVATGRQFAIMLENQTLTVMTEAVYSPGLDVPGQFKRRYGPEEARNSNLNFDGSRVAVGNSMDCWTFGTLADLEAFAVWYGSNASARPDVRAFAPSQGLPEATEVPDRPRQGAITAPGASLEMFSRYRPVLESDVPPRVRDPRLLIYQDGPVKIYYAPFEHLNHAARIVLVGITPGPTQMVNANNAAREALLRGVSEAEAVKQAKDVAAFSGEPMRSNLIRQLDHWGFHDWLGLTSSSELFDQSRHLVQSTSLLRYPVFVNEEDYRGQPNMLEHPLLRRHLTTHFVAEVEALDQAVFIGLGPQVQRVLNRLVAEGVLDADRVIGGILHPSGNCTYRINYLIGERRGETPHATNPQPYDEERAKFRAKYLEPGRSQ